MSIPTPHSALVDGELHVDGAPFLLLGAELHNSSSSTRAYLHDRWARLAGTGANTVLAAVSWAQWEPEEGAFDRDAVDHLLDGARAHGLRLVLLWFGSWKNGVSSYCPSWVKLDPDRFPLAVSHDGKPVQALSVFAEENRAADTRAFAALMLHLREADGEHGTVILVQVENEVGLLGTVRDHSAHAEAAWNAAPPGHFGAHARWQDVDADEDRAAESFMAWHYARYIDAVASAGRTQWPLPMYANAWLNSSPDPAVMSGGDRPGQYPSGGPVPHMLDVWRDAAPSLSFLSPDIYTDDLPRWARLYRDACGVLFIPEMKRAAPQELFVALGAEGAIGVSPFGVDSASDDEIATLTRAYRQLAAVSPDVLAGRRRQDVRGFAVTETEPTVRFRLGPHEFLVERDFDPQGAGDQEDGYGILVRDGDEYLLAGHGIVVRAVDADSRAPAWVLECVELALDDRSVLRVLNGDETGGGEIVRITRADPPSFGPVPICPSVTGLLRFRLYSAGG